MPSGRIQYNQTLAIAAPRRLAKSVKFADRVFPPRCLPATHPFSVPMAYVRRPSGIRSRLRMAYRSASDQRPDGMPFGITLGSGSVRPACFDKAPTSPLSAAAQQFPPHVGQHVADLIEQLVRLIEPARGFGTATRLAVSPPATSAMRASMRVMSGTEVMRRPSVDRDDKAAKDLTPRPSPLPEQRIGDAGGQTSAAPLTLTARRMSGRPAT